MASKRVSSLLTTFSSQDKSLPPTPSSATESPRMDSPTRRSPPSDIRSKSPAATSGRLRKPAPVPSSPRGAPPQIALPAGNQQPSLQDLQYGAPSPLLPPPTVTATETGSYIRSSSADRSSRPGTPNGNNRPGTPNSYSRPTTPTLQLPGQPPITPTSPIDAASNEKTKKKHRWFGSSKKDKDDIHGPVAWIAGHPQKLPYDTSSLLAAQPMQDLWDNNGGNCLVYLFPRTSGKGASFKVNSTIFASSPILSRFAFGDLDQRNSDTMSSASSRDSRARLSELSDTQEAQLFLPIKLHSDSPVAPIAPTTSKKVKEERPDPALDDLQTLVDIRNLFAFLCGQALVGTERKSSFFQIFMTIAGILKTYEFSNLDGSTYGEVASSSFDKYVEELGLADVRQSLEKTIDGVLLGERMKSVLLYNEAFTHAVGKHEDIVALKSPRFNLISPITQNRLVRAAMDLDKRTASVRLILNDFEFPSLFTGIMSSKQSEERKEGVRFDHWKDTFMGTRKFLMGLYGHRYGHWPPKASSKKNDLETSGLNRQVLRDLYYDLSSMYDLLVDRSNLTTRTVDGISLDQGAREEPTTRALRAVLSEYDRSSPPVKPPVPFDLPLLPSLRTTRSDYGTGDKKKDLKAISKKLKDDEIAQILRASWNDDAILTPFVEAFRDMEKRAAHGCTIAELVDLRIGQWIFMYVVLQALPMLACDAPGIKHTKGVEYFLCEPPRSGVPWANPNNASGGGHAGGMGGAGQRTWFSVGEGGGVVSLPSDVVEHGVEGIYRRSHCWVMAEKWSAANPILNSALHEQEAMNAAQAARIDGDNISLPPLPSSSTHAENGGAGLLRPDSRSSMRSSSPGLGLPMRNANRNSSLGMGLEALALPAGVSPDGRRASSLSPGPGPGSPGVGGRPVSVHAVDASKTFDAILADVGNQKKGKKGK